MRGLIDEPRRHRHALRSDQADKPVAQILALPEHERDQHQHDDGAGDRFENESRGLTQPFDRSQARRDDTNRLRTPQIRHIVVQLLGDTIDRAGELTQCGIVTHAQVGDLAAHRGRIFRDLRRELGELIENHITDASDGAQGQQHRQRHACKARQMPAVEQAHQRRQGESENDAEREREQHGFRGPQDTDDEQRHPRTVQSG